MPTPLSPVMQFFVDREQRRLAAQVHARNNLLNMANEALMDQIRDLRESLHMREEVQARRRRWYLSRQAHAYAQAAQN